MGRFGGRRGGRGGGPRRGRRGRGGGGGADRVHGRPQVGRRQEDQRHQGSPRHHQPRPQGGQGPRRGGQQARQGRHSQGRGGKDQETAGGGRSDGGDQISAAARGGRRFAGPRAGATAPPPNGSPEGLARVLRGTCRPSGEPFCKCEGARPSQTSHESAGASPP